MVDQKDDCGRECLNVTGRDHQAVRSGFDPGPKTVYVAGDAWDAVSEGRSSDRMARAGDDGGLTINIERVPELSSQDGIFADGHGLGDD